MLLSLPLIVKAKPHTVLRPLDRRLVRPGVGATMRKVGPRTAVARLDVVQGQTASESSRRLGTYTTLNAPRVSSVALFAARVAPLNPLTPDVPRRNEVREILALVTGRIETASNCPPPRIRRFYAPPTLREYLTFLRPPQMTPPTNGEIPPLSPAGRFFS